MTRGGVRARMLPRVSAGITGHLQILSAALLFSTGGAAIKLSAFSGWQIAGFRSVLAVAIFALLRPAWRDCLRPAVLAVGATYASVLVLFTLANKLTTAANTFFLQDTSFLWIMLLGPVLLKERLRIRDLGLGAVVVLGMVLIFLGAEPATHKAVNPPVGNLLAALAGFVWGLAILGLRALARTSPIGASNPADSAVLVGNVMVVLICLPLALPVRAAQPIDWLVVVYLGVFQLALAYVFMTRGMRHLPALEVALILLLEPVLSGVWAWLLHGEQPAPLSMAGYALILGAIASRALLSARGAPPLARPVPRG
jgi:drug/metabolite transporter (DMT)-like permease